jgi:hypothetical protein
MIAFFDEKSQNVLTGLANEVCGTKSLRVVGRRVLLGSRPMLYARRLLPEHEGE